MRVSFERGGESSWGRPGTGAASLPDVSRGLGPAGCWGVSGIASPSREPAVHPGPYLARGRPPLVFAHFSGIYNGEGYQYVRKFGPEVQEGGETCSQVSGRVQWRDSVTSNVQKHGKYSGGFPWGGKDGVDEGAVRAV